MRSLTSYLVLPRPGDAVKWWILPLTFGLGALAEDGVPGADLLRALAVWAVLELLIYQARYQWNDVRGFEADQRHPQAGERGRLPGPAERGRTHKLASRVVILARLGASAAVGLLLGIGTKVAVLTAAVFGVALLYEALRSRATGRSDELPPPARPAIVALWIVVGGGYAIRGVAGLSLATDLSGRPALAAAATVTMWAFGIAFVTGRWALEALAFARADGTRIAWSARAEQAREHTLALARWLPDRLERGVAPRDWHPLRGRTPLLAPWNLGLVVAAGAAGVTGRLLAGDAGMADGAAAAAAGALAGLAVAHAAPRARAVVLGSVCMAAVFAATGAPAPGLATLPWLGVAAAHAFFAAQSLATLAHPLRSALQRTDPAASVAVQRG